MIIGLPTLRLKGPYFVIATLGFGEIVRLILLNWDRVTRGPNGLIGIPSPGPIPLGVVMLTFNGKVSMYYLILAILLVVLVLYRNFVHSKINRALRAIHDDQIAAEVMGVNLTFYKIVGFCGGSGAIRLGRDPLCQLYSFHQSGFVYHRRSDQHSDHDGTRGNGYDRRADYWRGGHYLSSGIDAFL